MSDLAPLASLNSLGTDTLENTTSPAPPTSVSSPVGSSSPLAQSANPSDPPGTNSTIGSIVNETMKKTIPGLSAIESLANLSVSRVVAIVLGLILVGGGIIMFRPVGAVIGEGVGAAVKSGKEAAAAGV